MQKSENKKNFYGKFSLAVFLFPVIKGRKKKVVLFFSVSGEGQCEIHY